MKTQLGEGLIDYVALRAFIEAEMAQRDLSGRQFARLVGVSNSTIVRLLDRTETKPPTPSLEFLIKLASATGHDLCMVVQLLSKGERNVEARAALMMAQLAKLPPKQREMAETFLRGLVVQGGDE